MKPFFSFVGAIVFLAITAWFLLTYVLVSDEIKVKRVIEKGRCCVENGSILTISSLFAPQYRHENGMGSAEVLRILNDLFQQTKERRIRIMRNEIDVEGTQAEATVTFLFTGKTSHSHPVFQTLLSDSSEESQEVVVSFSKEGRSWKIQKTQIRRSQAHLNSLSSLPVESRFSFR